MGKTHLAVAVLRELVDRRKGARGQFWDFHELIREIKNSYDPETKTTELQVLEPVVETDVLLLDDLGAWKMTDWMNDTLFYILNSRYMAKRADAHHHELPGRDARGGARAPTRCAGASSWSSASASACARGSWRCAWSCAWTAATTARRGSRRTRSRSEDRSCPRPGPTASPSSRLASTAAVPVNFTPATWVPS